MTHATLPVSDYGAQGFATTTTTSSSLSSPSPLEVLCFSWNADASCLAVGTRDGFIIYNSEWMPKGPSVTGSSSTSASQQQQQQQQAPRRSGLVEVARRKVSGGVRCIALFEQSSLVLFSGASPETEKIVTLWDDAGQDGRPAAAANDIGGFAQPDDSNDLGSDVPLFLASAEEQCVLGTLELSTRVATLRLHEQLVVVAEPHRVHLYDKKLHHVATYTMPRFGSQHVDCQRTSLYGDLGALPDNTPQNVALATFATREVVRNQDVPIVRLVVLGPSVGSLRCVHYFCMPPPAVRSPPLRPSRASSITKRTGGGGGGGGEAAADVPPPLQQQQPCGFVEDKLVDPAPHHHSVQAVAISADGALALSSSVRGTTLKLIDTKRVVVLRQFNRGATAAFVTSLTFSVDSRFAACISGNGTVHVFEVRGSSSSGGGASSSAQAQASWGGSAVSMGLRTLQTVAPGSATLAGYQAFVSSEYAIASFPLSMLHADANDDTPAGGDGGAAKHSDVDIGSEFVDVTATDTAAGVPIASPAPSSSSASTWASAFHVGYSHTSDCFDTSFTALQFRAGIQYSSSNSGGIHLLVACGNVVPPGINACVTQSKVVQVVLPLTGGGGGVSGGRSDLVTSTSASSSSSSGAAVVVVPNLPAVRTTCLFPKDEL